MFPLSHWGAQVSPRQLQAHPAHQLRRALICTNMFLVQVLVQFAGHISTKQKVTANQITATTKQNPALSTSRLCTENPVCSWTGRCCAKCTLLVSDSTILLKTYLKVRSIGKGLCTRMFTPWSTNKGIIYIHVMGCCTAIQNYFQEIFKDLRMSS